MKTVAVAVMIVMVVFVFYQKGKGARDMFGNVRYGEVDKGGLCGEASLTPEVPVS